MQVTTKTYGNSDDGRETTTKCWCCAMSRHGRAKQHGPEPPAGVYTKPPPPVHGNNTYNGRAHHHYQQQPPPQHQQSLQQQQQFYGAQQQPNVVGGASYHHHSLPRCVLPLLLCYLIIDDGCYPKTRFSVQLYLLVCYWKSNVFSNVQLTIHHFGEVRSDEK